MEGVLYWLENGDEIRKMDRFEHAPVNYSREIVRVRLPEQNLPALAAGLETAVDGTPTATTWTYFANPAVRKTGLLPPRSYLDHLLAGEPFLSREYYRTLVEGPCEESR